MLAFILFRFHIEGDENVCGYTLNTANDMAQFASKYAKKSKVVDSLLFTIGDKFCYFYFYFFFCSVIASSFRCEELKLLATDFFSLFFHSFV